MFNNILYLIKTTYRKHFLEGVAIAFAWLLHAVSKFLFIILSQKVFDIYCANGFVREFIIGLLMLTGALLIDQLSITMGNALAESSTYLILRELSDSLQHKVKMQNAINFEKSDYLDALERAREGTENGAYLLNVVQMVSCFQIPYLVMVSIYLLNKNPLLFLAFVFISIPGCINQLKKQKDYQELAEKLAPFEREYDAYEQTFTGKDSFLETRFWQCGGTLQSKMEETIENINKRKLTVAKESLFRGIISQVLSALCYGVALINLAWNSINGFISIGALVAIFTSFTNVSDLIRDLVCEYWGQISEQSGNVKHLVSFVKEEDANESSKKVKDIDTIEIKNVSFSYPGDSQKVLKDISFSSQKKEVIAIVGENGSGKTTLLKVISGLYPCTAGDVFVNGEKGNSRLLCNCSFVFQNYQRYAMSVKDNICLGQSMDSVLFDSILEKAGLKSLVAQLGTGSDTFLSKEFGGIELSGGMWQRVAIARGIAKDSELFMLDEPTSAIDPIEESALYKLFLNIGKGKRMFIVTHRMGICKSVDRIIVMKNGELVEDGSHDELMDRKGEYYRLFSAQAGLYRQ